MCKVWFGNWHFRHCMRDFKERINICVKYPPQCNGLKSSKKLSWFLISQPAWRDTWHSGLTIQVTICPRSHLKILLFSVSPSVSRRTISLPTFVSRRKRGGLLAETRAIPIIAITSSTPDILNTLIPCLFWSLWSQLHQVWVSPSLSVTVHCNTTICKNILVQDSEIPW